MAACETRISCRGLVGSANFMRLSLMKAAHAAMGGDAQQEIRGPAPKAGLGPYPMRTNPYMRPVLGGPSSLLMPNIHGDQTYRTPSPGFQQASGCRECYGAVSSQLRVTAIV